MCIQPPASTNQYVTKPMEDSCHQHVKAKAGVHVPACHTPSCLFQPKGCSAALQMPLQLPYQLLYNCIADLIQLPSCVQCDDHPRHKEHRTSIVACTNSDTCRTAASTLFVLRCCLLHTAPGDKLVTCMFRQCAPAAFSPDAACTHGELYAHNCGDGIPLLESGTAHHGVQATALRGRCRHHCWGHPQGHHGEGC